MPRVYVCIASKLWDGGRLGALPVAAGAGGGGGGGGGAI